MWFLEEESARDDDPEDAYQWLLEAPGHKTRVIPKGSTTPADSDPVGTPLTETEAEALSTAIATYSALFEHLDAVYQHGLELTETEKDNMQTAGTFVVQHSLEKLSDKAETALKPILEDVKASFLGAAVGTEAPNAIWQAQMEKFLSETYWSGGTAPYSAYEFHRLARTEAAFAAAETDRKFFKDQFEASTAAVDAVGAMTPLHPNCNCTEDIKTGEDGIDYVVIWPSSSACDYCLSVVEDVDAHVGTIGVPVVGETPTPPQEAPNVDPAPLTQAEWAAKIQEAKSVKDVSSVIKEMLPYCSSKFTGMSLDAAQVAANGLLDIKMALEPTKFNKSIGNYLKKLESAKASELNNGYTVTQTTVIPHHTTVGVQITLNVNFWNSKAAIDDQTKSVANSGHWYWGKTGEGTIANAAGTLLFQKLKPTDMKAVDKWYTAESKFASQTSTLATSGKGQFFSEAFSKIVTQHRDTWTLSEEKLAKILGIDGKATEHKAIPPAKPVTPVPTSAPKPTTPAKPKPATPAKPIGIVPSPKVKPKPKPDPAQQMPSTLEEHFKASKAYLGNLKKTDPEAYAAMRDYTGSVYWSLNEQLRTGGTLTAAQAKMTKGIDRGLANAPKFSGRVKRGISVSKDVRNAMAESTEIEFNAFTSTSNAPGGFGGFSGNVYFDIVKTKSGTWIEPLSHYKHENEVLFPRGMKVKVLEVQWATAGSSVTIVCEEI